MRFLTDSVCENDRIVTLFDKEKQLDVQLIYTVLPDCPVLSRKTRITNRGAERVVLNHVSSFVHPSQCENWSKISADMNVEQTEFVLTNSLMGRMCISGVFSECGVPIHDAVKRAVDFYKKTRFILQNPKVYYHSEPVLITDTASLKGMEYLSFDEQYALLYATAADFSGEYTVTPAAKGMHIVDAFPNQTGVTEEAGRIRFSENGGLFGHVLLLQKH